MEQLKTLKDLFFHEIQVMWSAEDQLVKAMPKMIEHATNEGLKQSLAMHLAETEKHRTTMAFIAQQLGIDPEGDFNPGIKGILEEGDKVMAKESTPATLDATLIAGAQKVEHYEISGYGSAAYYASLLGYKEIASQLYLILEEEKQADSKLNFLAKELINEKSQME